MTHAPFHFMSIGHRGESPELEIRESVSFLDFRLIEVTRSNLNAVMI